MANTCRRIPDKGTQIGADSFLSNLTIAARNRHSLATTFEMSQWIYLRSETTTVHMCICKPQYFNDNHKDICGLTHDQNSSWLHAVVGHNIWLVTERVFLTTRGHNSLCPKAIAIEQSQDQRISVTWDFISWTTSHTAAVAATAAAANVSAAAAAAVAASAATTVAVSG